MVVLPVCRLHYQKEWSKWCSHHGISCAKFQLCNVTLAKSSRHCTGRPGVPVESPASVSHLCNRAGITDVWLLHEFLCGLWRTQPVSRLWQAYRRYLKNKLSGSWELTPKVDLQPLHTGTDKSLHKCVPTRAHILTHTLTLTPSRLTHSCTLSHPSQHSSLEKKDSSILFSVTANVRNS